MAEPTSWILDVRQRLAAAPALEPVVADTARRALLVPLFVDVGGLWALLREGAGGEPEYPSAPVAPGEDAWAAAQRAAGEAGLPAEAILPLGELSPLEPPEGGLALPCIGALPTPAAQTAGESGRFFRIPLIALRSPTLVEELEVDTPAGDRRRVRALHVGGRRLWGTAVFVLEDLLERLAG
jgi:hypothetical protein